MLTQSDLSRQTAVANGVGLWIKRSSVRIRPWPLRWVLGQGSLLPLSSGEAFTLGSISYLAILVKYILAKKKPGSKVMTSLNLLDIQPDLDLYPIAASAKWTRARKNSVFYNLGFHPLSTDMSGHTGTCPVCPQSHNGNCLWIFDFDQDVSSFSIMRWPGLPTWIDSGNPGHLVLEKELTAWWKSNVHTQFPLRLRWSVVRACD